MGVKNIPSAGSLLPRALPLAVVWTAMIGQRPGSVVNRDRDVPQVTATVFGRHFRTPLDPDPNRLSLRYLRPDHTVNRRSCSWHQLPFWLLAVNDGCGLAFWQAWRRSLVRSASSQSFLS